MNRPVGAPVLHRLQGLAAVLDELVVDDVDLAARCQNGDQAWNGVHDQARLALTFAEGLLGALALVDIDEQVVPADDMAVRIPKRKSAGLKPAVDAIETSSTYFELEGFT
jgi:hypothetical protein